MTAAREAQRVLYIIMASRTRQVRDQALGNPADRGRRASLWALMAGDVLHEISQDWRLRRPGRAGETYRAIGLMLRDAAQLEAERAGMRRFDGLITTAPDEEPSWPEQLETAQRGADAQALRGPDRPRVAPGPVPTDEDGLAEAWTESMGAATAAAFERYMHDPSDQRAAEYRLAHAADLRGAAQRYDDDAIEMLAQACETAGKMAERTAQGAAAD